MDETAKTILSCRRWRSFARISDEVNSARRCARIILLLVVLLLSSSSMAEANWQPTTELTTWRSALDRGEPFPENHVSSSVATLRPLADVVDRFQTPATSEVDKALSVPVESFDDQSLLRSEPILQESCGLNQYSCGSLPWSRFDERLTPWEFIEHDFGVLFHNLDDDFRHFWELENVLFTGAGLGLAIGLRGSVDDDVRDYTAEHPQRWGGFSDTLSLFGNAEVQIAGIGLMYGYAYHNRDSELMNFTRLLIRSYTLTGLSTLVIKGIANTDRPTDSWNNGNFGFPSAHVSLSFAFAATIEEYYGPRAGIPAYLTASLIGWSRLDQRDHDLSDVVFGAVLGYAIAKSIAGQELRNDSRIRMFPWTDPVRNNYGAMFEFDF